MSSLSWPQVAALAFTILAGILGAGWAIVRPLIKALFENVVVARLDGLEAKLDEVTKDHDERVRAIENEQAELRGALKARGCLAITEGHGPRCPR